VSHETSRKCNVNLSTHIGVEQDIVNTLKQLSNRFLSLEPPLVVQCLEISQLLILVYLSRRCFASILVQFTMLVLDQIEIIMQAFKHKTSSNRVTDCFKLGLLKINTFLDADHIKTIVVSCHVSLCIKCISENQHQQAINILSTVDQYLDSDNELVCLVCYLKAFAHFNLDNFEEAFYYLSQMDDYLMEPFVKSRYNLLLGRIYSKMGNKELAISTFTKLQSSVFSRIMAYYMLQHYELNNLPFTQIMVLEQTIKVIYFIFLIIKSFHIMVFYNCLGRFR